MNIILRVFVGLIAGYLIGIVLAATAAFVFGLEDAARFIAIGCGLIGALAGPIVFSRLRVGQR